MTITFKKSPRRSFKPTAKQGYGQRAAFDAKRAVANVASEIGAARIALYEFEQPVVSTKRRREVA